MENLIDMKFGEWTVLARDNSNNYKTRDKRWICECSCGTIKSVLGKYLKNEHSLSCGCLKKKDLTGQRFERLTVVETIYGYNGNKRATYRCICDCGNELYLEYASLCQQKSCGCIRKPNCIGERYGKLIVMDMLYKYTNNETYCLCDCECGSKNNIVRLNALRTGNTTSCGCKHSPFLVGQRFGMMVVLEEIDSDTNQRMWKCLCDCGNIVHRTSAELKYFYSCGCLQNKSKMEAYVAQLLKNYEITYEPQKRFDDCRDVFPLPFDFYLSDYNMAIECDGIQHFEPIKHFGGVERFKIRQQHDRIKNVYCSVNNIQLLRIPYTMSNEDIASLLLNNIKILESPVTTTVV
jgi:hypothetical protein